MPGLTEARLFFSFAGVNTALATLRYTLRRRKWDRCAPAVVFEHLSAESNSPGRLIEIQAVPGGAFFVFEQAGLEAAFLAPDFVRLSWEPGLPPLPYAIGDREWAPPEINVSQSKEGFHLASPAIRITVHPDGAVTCSDDRGVDIRSVSPPRYKPTSHGPTWTDTVRLRPDEHLYGLGEHTGPLNLRGRTYTFWNSDPSGSYGPGDDPVYMTFPVIMGMHSGGSYLVFYENAHPGCFSAPGMPPDPATEQQPEPVEAKITFTGGMLRSYLIVGTPQRLLECYTDLTGRPPLPPRWSLGYHQSRWGYKTEAEIRALASEFTCHEMPISAIHLDIDYMDGYRVFTVDKRRFPDLKRLSADLEAQGIRLVTIIDPGVKCDPEYDVYAQGTAERRFCFLPGVDEESNGEEIHGVVWPGWSAFPDFTHPETRDWWAGLYPRLLNQGIAGIWHDMNEPASFVFDGDNRLPYAVRHHLEGRLGDHREAHNLYALLMNRAGYEGLRRARPAARPWIVSRSGWASQQRYAWNWTGDVESTWKALQMTVATVINCGLSGLPFTGSDIGGFSGCPSEELYLRWLQAAAFMPFCRTHSAINVPRREPWSCCEPYTTWIRDALRLRYRLLPYIYSLAWEASQTGAPLVRPLFWADPHDSRLWSVGDSFLLGPALLVAPILEPDVEGREVILPAGLWYYFWDDAANTGFDRITVECGLERIPLFVRAGSVLPLDTKDGLELHLYPPAGQSSPVYSRLYVDSGDGYEEGTLIDLTLESSGGALNLDCRRSGPADPLLSSVRFVTHADGGEVIRFNGSPVAGNINLNSN